MGIDKMKIVKGVASAGVGTVKAGASAYQAYSSVMQDERSVGQGGYPQQQ